MKFSALLALAAAATSVVAAPTASPATTVQKRDLPSTGRCENPTIRKAWHTLTNDEKDNFINAVKCLHTLPPKLTAVVPGTGSRYEDYIAEHKIQAPYIHLVGHFLPWHRLYLLDFEQALQNECGYTGTLPYWDYSRDAADHSKSEVWDTVHGFGSDGVIPDGETKEEGNIDYCVEDGPFANWKINIAMYADTGANPRCLSRNFLTDLGARWFTAEEKALVQSKPDYGSFALSLEAEPNLINPGVHGAGHWAVGGSASDPFTSNTDPTFYLHHTNLDRIWWEWQNMDLENRMYEMGGTIKPRDPILGGDIDGLSGNVTIDFDINLGTLGGAEKYIKVEQVMDILGGNKVGSSLPGVLCYQYDTTV